MKYMLFIYGTPFGARAPGEVAAGAAFERSLAESGELVAHVGMADPGHARIVRGTSGPPVVTPGPYRDGNERLAGWFVVDCESRDRAVELAAQYPHGGGGVEVWPLLETAAADM